MQKLASKTKDTVRITDSDIEEANDANIVDPDDNEDVHIELWISLDFALAQISLLLTKPVFYLTPRLISKTPPSLINASHLFNAPPPPPRTP